MENEALVSTEGTGGTATESAVSAGHDPASSSVQREDVATEDRGRTEQPEQPEQTSSGSRFTVSISISPDEMKATLTISAASAGGSRGRAADDGSRGGAATGAPSVEEVLAECKRQVIVFGLDPDAVRKAVDKAKAGGKVRKALIAQGEEAIDGDPGALELKVRLATGAKAKKLEDGSVDYKQQDLVTQVNKGDLLAVYTEPTSGKKDGRTVTGVVIEAKPGAGREVRAGEHIRVERHEGAIHYYAETDGRLLYEDGGSGDGGLSVDPVLTIDGDVGPETGNIDFLGSVHVHGDVDDNYTVTAKNGIVIDGSVRGAVLQSDGDIEVKNGIIGKNRAKVLARGSITAKFAESARIKACGCITIRHGAMNCLILSGNRIMSLEHKGHVVGGTLEAKYGVEVKELGNELENRTEVSVGRDFVLDRQIHKLKNNLRRSETASEQLQEKMTRIAESCESVDDLPARLKQVYVMLHKKNEAVKASNKKLSQAVEHFSEQIDDPARGEVVVHETLHRGVLIRMGEHYWQTESELKGLKVIYDGTQKKITTTAA